MSALSFLAPWRGREEVRALTRENVQPTGSLLLGQPTLAGPPVSERLALQIVDVLACVRLLAETASTLPLLPYRRTEAGRVRLTSGRLPDLLRRPAPAVTQPNLIGQLVGSLACRGSGFVGKYRNGDGQIEQLGVLPPERVEVEIKGGLPLYRLTGTDGRQTIHDAADVLFVRMPLTEPNGVLGLSPIAMAREALGLARALGQHASALVGNESTPLGVLSVPPGPGADDAISALREGWEDRHRGARNAGRVAVLSGEIKFSALSLSPEDAQFVEQRKLSTQEVARLFRVPPWLIGAESGSSLTYSTVEGQMRAFLVLSLAPYLVAIEEAISNDRDLCPGDTYVEFMRQAILEPDALVQAQIFQLALDPITGWLRRDEVRAMLNRDPEPAPVPEAA
jgi:HK97 family phage portal protein